MIVISYVGAMDAQMRKKHLRGSKFTGPPSYPLCHLNSDFTVDDGK